MTPLEFETSNEAHWKELERAVALPDKQLNPERLPAALPHLLRAPRARPGARFSDARSSSACRSSRRARIKSSIGRPISASRGSRARCCTTFRPWCARIAATCSSPALLVLVPTLALGIAVYRRPELILSIVDSRTAAEFEHMYDPASPAIGRLRDSGSDWAMFGFYIMNNIGIAFQCYVTGLLFGVGSVWYLVFNGAFGGAIGGYIASMGYGGTFFPFIATHSAFEVTAIILSGAAGLRIGRSVLLPGTLVARSIAADRRARDQPDRVRRRGHAGDRGRHRGVLVLGGLGHAHGQIQLRRGVLDRGGAVFPAAAACRLNRSRWCCVRDPPGRDAISACACCNPGCGRCSPATSPSRCRCSPCASRPTRSARGCPRC